MAPQDKNKLPDGKYGNLNAGQKEALESAISKLKANGNALLHAVLGGKAVDDFTVTEKPVTAQEQSDEAFAANLRGANLAAPAAGSFESIKKSIEQATVHLSKENKNVKIEIQTPYGLHDHPSLTDIKRNFLVANVNEKGELMDTPKVEVHTLTDTVRKIR